MVRQTSIDAYNTIKANGLLKKRKWQIYSVLYDIGPATGGEVFKEMKERYSTTIPTNSNTTTRLGELRDNGTVMELGNRVCSVSNQAVTLWDVTDGLPKKLGKKKTKDQIIKELQAEIVELKAKIEDLEWK